MYKSDTISLGRLQEGEYKIEFSFIDVYNPPQDNSQPTEIYEKEFIFLAEMSFPQEKFSFVDDDMLWSYITSENTDRGSMIVTTTYKYNGDTIIKDVSYKKMYKSVDNGTNWHELGYFRQEDNNVYYIPRTETKEILVYNFSKDMEYRIQSNYYDIGLASDSIIVDNVKKARWGVYHKVPNSTYQQELSDNIYDFDDVIIEDIGSVYSPTFDTLPYTPGGVTGARYYTFLLCVLRGNNVIWHNSQYEDCYYEQTAIDNIADQQIALSPNPVKDKLTLSLPNTENEIKIFDLQGKLLLQQNVGFSAEIIVSMLPMGTYVLVVNGESYKFVKE
ncbi:MAG: T9SS type A sorting domain-containing protein [Bacteroidales bacterium]|nr:T9SS type A sorting domain-containing protein [Bacteroidales bacterium]